MKISLGCDHGGYELNKIIKTRLEQSGYEVINKGIFELEEVDYPDIARMVAESIIQEEADCGILICGTGIGMSIAANKVKGIRAALITDSFSARMAKEHNNANVITLGARTLGTELAWELITTYLEAVFLGEKHEKRIEKIMAIEQDSAF